MSKYPDPRDYRDIHEFMDKYQEDIEKGYIDTEYMIEVCDFLLEMASSDLRAVCSQIKRIYLHLLKYRYQPTKQTRSWINSIRNARSEISDAINSSKSLRNKIDLDSLETIYNNARKDAANETHLDKKVFPDVLPLEFNLDNISDSGWIENYLIRYMYSNDAKKELNL